ncbi:hypothetical protein LZD49_03360 [Dyadobacter sp. CY261]|uniref:hypothetical protein n=1 Tax=Dyadobacter sp. CY261 TaxID=2907203 RepID=UPI001F395B7C|nr:hypothetical protein [Dyadobacter sp. CY261]MCF0069493.1 hypothetical protein [Dyadobacter sp. CY261]
MNESGSAPVTTLRITTVLDVPDQGCGDGTTAIPAAKLGAYGPGRIFFALRLLTTGHI